MRREKPMIKVAVPAIVTVIALVGTSHADEILMDRVSAIEAARDHHPPRGATMNRVMEAHGEPDDAFKAVGEPPITRWVYEDFTVYFEHDRVIHSVANRR